MPHDDPPASAFQTTERVYCTIERPYKAALRLAAAEGGRSLGDEAAHAIRWYLETIGRVPQSWRILRIGRAV